MNRQRRRGTRPVWLVALGAWLLFESAYAGDLFLPLAADGGQVKAAAGVRDSGLRGGRRVAIAHDLLSSARAQVERGGASALSLNVGEGLHFDVLAEHSTHSRWGYSLSGRTVGGPPGFVTLVVHDEAMAGHLWTGEKSYEILPLGDGTHVVREAHEAANIQCAAMMTAQSPPTAATANDGPDDGSVVDILVVWTPAEEARVGGESSIKARIDLAIAFTNDAFRRSGIFTSLKLVGAQEVDYDEETDGETTPERLSTPQDGHLDDVLALRDELGADLVHLFARGAIAYLGGAFAISNNVLYFAHEIGHNFGVDHARDVRIHSYQHAFGDAGFGQGCGQTITTNGGCASDVVPRILPYYSSPALWDPRHGRPLGVSRFQPAGVRDGPADAVLTINRSRHVVANFRPSRADSGAAAPLSLPNGVARPGSMQQPVRLASKNGQGIASTLVRTEAGDPETVVEIPDANLRRAVERELSKASGAPITKRDMASLSNVSTTDYVHQRGRGVRDLAGIEHAVNLVSLHAPLGSISDLSPLSGLRHLQYLELPDNYIMDITPLAGLELRALYLQANYLSDLGPLAANQSLVRLSLSLNQISDVSALSNLSSLEWLGLAYNQVQDVTALAGLDSLRKLWLGSNRVSRLAPVADLGALTYLQLSGNNIADLAPLVANSGLGEGDRVEVYENPLSAQSIGVYIPVLLERGVEVLAPSGPNPDEEEWVAEDPKLYEAVQQWVEHRYYTAVGVPVTVADLARLTTIAGRDRGIVSLAGLESAASLYYLDLGGNSIGDLSPLAGLDNLRHLHLNGNEISDISPLDGLSLEYLSLSDNNIENVLPLAGADLNVLTWLALDGNNIHELPVLSARGIKYLHAVDNSIADLAPLAHLTLLRELRLSGNRVASVEPLSGLSNLEFLHLSDNQVADISDLNVESLVELHVKNNAVQDLSRLRDATNLAFVDVRGNPLADSALAELGALRERGVTVLAGETAPYFPAAGDGRQGFVRVVNQSDSDGHVLIEAVDDAGVRAGPVRLQVGARGAVHFNSADLQYGNAAKGIAGLGAPSAGDWRLAVISALDVEVLSYVRTEDGFVTAMHDATAHAQVPFFNPGSNQRQRSILRVVNTEAVPAMWTSGGYDDRGKWRRMVDALLVRPGRALSLTAQALENVHGLGDGGGKWRLRARGFPWLTMSLLESPTGHLANLSTAPNNGTPLAQGGTLYRLPLFPAAGGLREGFARLVNRSYSSGEVAIEAVDDAGNRSGPVRLTLAPRQTVHFTAADLEAGNAAKGLDGGVGVGTGDWRLEVASELELMVLAYARTADGFVTSLHDLAPVAADGSHRVVFFNPGSNRRQVSKLRLINNNERAAEVAIAGIDDAGQNSEAIALRVPARQALYFTSEELEAGGERLEGSLGDGAGKWRLRVTADAPLAVMSLLESPTGHLANVSTAPAR